MKFHLNIIGPVLLASFCLLLYGLSGEAAVVRFLPRRAY